MKFGKCSHQDGAPLLIFQSFSDPAKIVQFHEFNLADNVVYIWFFTM